MSNIVEHLISVFRAEPSEAHKFFALLAVLFLIVAGIIYIHSYNVQQGMILRSAQSSLRTLLSLAEDYKSVYSPSSVSPSQNVDVAAVFANISENMSLGSRLTRITPDGNNQSVEINSLYAEELVSLQKQLSSRGVRFIAAEIRALPVGKQRLFSVSAVIAPSNS